MPLLHGFEHMEDGCILRITGWIEGKNVYFSVRDNGKGMAPEKVEQIMSEDCTSIGMRNVHNRLKLMYGDEYGITVQSNVGYGTQILIRLPLVNNI